ncbi:amino acid adenylation domain-containing protein [Streptomyces sp. HC44]|uniref:Amino acid adenylation domain-containing protein n=1 Tax=Streptomyces scabichelini TaxID=2711217 RepID=A0A6G4V1N7_9ACTN|nr:non-ribosomal peptide synthetase [Streptomyces scabichelini]NGO07968.1 amino acid adenylation domain-containing protein [Streptomyces scabichelini]
MKSESARHGSLDEAITVHELVANQAARTPDAIAVTDGSQALTYAELEARANRLAHLLRDHGVVADSRVGICLGRSLDLVTAVLGVWKAGAAYAPMDPAQPSARLEWLLEDLGGDLVLTDEATAPTAERVGVRPLVLGSADTARQLADRSADRPPALEVHPAQAAYAIYTSGSTGRPKGVVITHEGIANRVRWAVDTHGLGARDRVLQKTAVTFDASCWEIFAPLIGGGTVVLAPPGAERDPAALLRAVAEHEVSVLQVVPSVLQALAEEPAWADCTALRLLFSAGEPLHAELAQRILARRPGLTIWNTYGPTECAIDVTAHRFDPATTTGPVPIGRPIPGMRVLVLDAAGTPAAIGAPGELHVGGVGVARGYLGRPDLTADRFVPDPYGRTGGARLYRTGDRVRWNPNGYLEYLGRFDDQTKVNGVRIEPGEIEAALVTHPGVRAAVVVPVTTGEDGAVRLAAHLLLHTSEALGELRDFLRDRLPESHVPAAFMDAGEFPLTAHGKVDRAALAARGLDAGPARTAPRTDAEKLVAGVWEHLLKTEDVGVHDDFFQLGGSSLQLTRLANQLRAAAKRDIPLRGLLTATTVEAQALLIAPHTDTPAADPAAPDTIPPVPRGGTLPVSSGQRRLWALDRMNPNSAEWVAGVFLPVPPEADTGVVRTALDALVARHESLRTRYVTEDGEPRQRIDTPAPVALRETETTREGLAGLLGTALGDGFDLERGPLLRATLVRTLDDRQRVLLLAVHHICSDGWSTQVLQRDFHELITAAVTGREPLLPPLGVQYADYADWQRARLTDDAIERELAHWRAVLDGSTPVALPTDRPRPAARDGRGSAAAFTVPAPVVTALTDLGRSRGATPFMTLLTAYATLLARHTAQWDLPVGTPVAGRDRPELEDVVGFFLNNVVLRCGLDADLTFVEALDRVRDTCRDAFAHHDLPFDLLVEALAPERDLSRTPLYQVAFDLHDQEFTGRATSLEDNDTVVDAWRLAHTDLTLLMRRGADGSMDGVFEYATALFEHGTMERLADQFPHLLRAVAAGPDTRLADLPVVPARESGLLAEWSVGAGPVVERPVVEMFEEQAARLPDAVAVVCGDVSLTYAELDARANRLAHHLRALGAGSESVVGVLLERGVELMTALLAVWKAGAGYVPLDPVLPGQRVAGMLADAGAQVLVGRGPVAGFDGALVDVDADATAIAERPSSRPEGRIDVDHVAYVVFTSGSTGRPKGVVVSHRGLGNHVGWAVRELASCGDGGGAVFSSIAFDLVVPNVWAPLCAGQRVALFPPDAELDELGGWLVGQGPFSFLKLTPGHLEVLSHQVTPEQAAALAGVVVVAGEALPGSPAARWAGWLGEGRLINEYGPTEASVGTTIHPVPLDADVDAVVPIGRPLPGMRVHVLDERMRPVPVGAVGELYVGGAGVARGYVGRPELTAERFVPDPFGAAGDRLYRTGDMVRWNATGAVEFLGRVDDQVKIRGYRVEPAEVSAVLAACPLVREAVVVARAEHGEPRLVGYVVPAAGAGTAPAEELAAHLAQALPEYMVPSAFVELDAVPLNANGKVDRKALPAPADGTDDPERVAPRNDVEERIAELWQEVLGESGFGVHDSFFAVGGNSILAIRLIAALRAEYEIDLPVRALFEGPTVAALAESVETCIRNEIDMMSDLDVADSTLLKEQN